MWEENVCAGKRPRSLSHEGIILRRSTRAKPTTAPSLHFPSLPYLAWPTTRWTTPLQTPSPPTRNSAKQTVITPLQTDCLSFENLDPAFTVEKSGNTRIHLQFSALVEFLNRSFIHTSFFCYGQRAKVLPGLVQYIFTSLLISEVWRCDSFHLSIKSW